MRRQAEVLLRSAAAQGYDDAYYWVALSQADDKKALQVLEQANGSGGMGIMALVVAAEAHAKGTGVPADFAAARAVCKRAVAALVDNTNRGIPAPPGEWWSNAKWSAGYSAIMVFAPRYGYHVDTVDGKSVLRETTPRPDLSDKELFKMDLFDSSPRQPAAE